LSVHTAEVRVAAADFVARMTKMRVWLDSRRFEPLVFRYVSAGGAVLVRVDFATAEEARAFAAEFSGQVLG
jgi:hypothetical protein